MSQWTHVHGIIRIDNLLGITPPPDLGVSCTFEDDEDKWTKCTIPCGSEGSLITTLWENPHKSSLNRYTVSIFGDLRDYNDEKEIVSYFTKITKEQMVRNGVFGIDIEGQKELIYIYQNEKWIKL